MMETLRNRGMESSRVRKGIRKGFHVGIVLSLFYVVLYHESVPRFRTLLVNIETVNTTIFDTRTLHVPNPTTSHCLEEFKDDEWKPIDSKVPVPLGSKFQLNNDFNPVVLNSNLNIVVIGDSVGDNIWYMLEKAYGLNPGDRETLAKISTPQGYNVDKIRVNQLPSKRGGGYLAFIRILKLLKYSNEGKDWRDWDPQHFSDLLEVIGKADVVLYRTPWPWMTRDGNVLGTLTPEDYSEVYEIIQKTLAPKAVIMLTTAPNNNALIQNGVTKLQNDNNAVRNFVNGLPADQESVMLMDWEKLTNEIVIANGEVMSVPAHKALSHITTGENATDGYRKKQLWFPHLTAMSCSGTVQPSENSVGTCPSNLRGLVSIDGMHWCQETVGPRTAGMAICLITCVVEKEQSSLSYRQCGEKCDSMFMNMSTKYDDISLSRI